MRARGLMQGLTGNMEAVAPSLMLTVFIHEHMRPLCHDHPRSHIT